MSNPCGFPSLPAPGDDRSALCNQLLSRDLMDGGRSVCRAVRSGLAVFRQTTVRGSIQGRDPCGHDTEYEGGEPDCAVKVMLLSRATWFLLLVTRVWHRNFHPVHAQKTLSQGMSKYISPTLLKHRKGLLYFKYLQHEVRHTRDIYVYSPRHGAILLFGVANLHPQEIFYTKQIAELNLEIGCNLSSQETLTPNLLECLVEVWWSGGWKSD